MPAVIVCCADMHDDKKLCKTKNKTQQKQNTAKTLTPFCARLFGLKNIVDNIAYA